MASLAQKYAESFAKVFVWADGDMDPAAGIELEAQGLIGLFHEELYQLTPAGQALVLRMLPLSEEAEMLLGGIRGIFTAEKLPGHFRVELGTGVGDPMVRAARELCVRGMLEEAGSGYRLTAAEFAKISPSN
jgi:hypothetical protein